MTEDGHKTDAEKRAYSRGYAAGSLRASELMKGADDDDMAIDDDQAVPTDAGAAA